MVKYYNRKYVIFRCFMRIDFRKVYDSVDWGFVEEIFDGFGFFRLFKNQVFECIIIISFLIRCNGFFYGFFKGEKGFRQGDFILFLIFVFVMEYFLKVIYMVGRLSDFILYFYCKELGFNYMIFADDFMIFFKGYEFFINRVNEVLYYFYRVSGMQVKKDKLQVYITGVKEDIRGDLL